jgi:serine/threonine-protein kinase
MGSVWLAEHTLLRARVAVKLMGEHVRAHPALRARFEREALAAAQLKSPHIVAVQDYGFDGDVPFMVMELLEGEDLARRLQRGGRMAPLDALAIAVPMAKGLAKAHTAGVVHRDLKPANIFLARVDDDEVVKIVDFGIAKVALGASGTPDDPTSADSIIGSPTYMSPEQVRAAREVDGRSDLWAFAVILFRMLTAAVPFAGGSQGDLLVKICTEKPRRAADIVPSLPPSVDAFFERALQKDPAHRYATAQEMVNAFAAALGQRHPFEPAARISLAGFEPTPSQPVLMEQAQTLATNNIGPRPAHRLPASTLALAAAPVVALAGIALLAVLRSAPNEPTPPANDPAAATRVVDTADRILPSPPTVSAVPSPEPSTTQAAPVVSATTSSAASSASAVASATASAARGPASPASGKPRERIRFGL